MQCHDHQNRTDTQEILLLNLGRLKAAGLKLTRQREALLRAAMAFRTPFTTDQLREACDAGMDLVTTYRTLAKFVEAGLLVTCGFGRVGDRTVRYELAPVDHSHHHHHIICTFCQRVDPVRACVLEGQDKDLRRLGYRDVTHKLEFFGVCPGCAKRETRRGKA